MDEKLIINARKPQGELGSKLLDRMNESHEKLAKWGVNHLDINKDLAIKKHYDVLDIGCGGGVNVKRFSEIFENGKIYGIDYSEISVEKTIELNKTAIEEGKIEIIQGSVSDLPYEDNSFDLITAFETIYFWPNFTDDLKEVYRVLKPNGKFLICNEATGSEDVIKKMEKHIKLLDMKIYSESELESSLLNIGFNNIRVFKKEKKDWITIIANKS